MRKIILVIMAVAFCLQARAVEHPNAIKVFHGAQIKLAACPNSADINGVYHGCFVFLTGANVPQQANTAKILGPGEIRRAACTGGQGVSPTSYFDCIIHTNTSKELK